MLSTYFTEKVLGQEIAIICVLKILSQKTSEPSEIMWHVN
jgi:hypothetical protein